MQKRLCWLWVLLLLIGSTFAQDETILSVDASQSQGTISPLVYGANVGLAVIPPDLIPDVQALGLKFLRVGGNYSDQNDLTKFTVDIYAAQAKMIGAELALSVRLLDGTPEAAADILRYANIEKGHNIRYWSIGNEPSFFVPVHGAESYTTEDLNREWRAMAEAMLAVDPNIILVGPDISQYVVLNVQGDTIEYLEGNRGGAPRDPLGRDWMQEFLRANGDLLGVVSVHRYPYPGGERVASATIAGLRENSHEWDVSIPNLRQVVQMAAGRDMPLAVTEVNSNSIPTTGGEAGPDTLYNAIWFADVLGNLIRHKTEIVAYWNLRSQTDGHGLFGLRGINPVAYIYMLYKHFGTELLIAETSNEEVSIFAAQREDGTVTLMVVNLADDTRDATVQFTGFTPAGDAEVWRYDVDHKAEMIDSLAITDGTTLTLPGQSVTLYILPAE